MVRFVTDMYGHLRYMRAYVGDDELAFWHTVPAGISLRWIDRLHTDPNFIQIFRTEDEARAEVVAHVVGLTIVPWDAEGREER